MIVLRAESPIPQQRTAIRQCFEPNRDQRRLRRKSFPLPTPAGQGMPGPGLLIRD